MIIVLVFIITIAIGLPIAYVLGSTAIVHAISMNDVNLFAMLPQRMFAAVNNFSLMAIPLFILAGEIMGFGGITEKLANMMRAFIGHIKGGIAYTTVLVGTALGALLGSANASAALLGDTMFGEMQKDGYDDGFSASLIAGTSLLGPIIPPSMVFIVYGVASNVSVAKLFFAGIIPGLMMTCGFFVLIGFYVRNRNVPTHPSINLKGVIKSIIEAVPALIVPVVILGGILGGVTTPTEAAATACFTALIVGAFVYRKLKWSQIPHILDRTGVISASILFIVAMSNILGWTLALDQIPTMIAEGLLAISTNKYVLLLLINILLFIVGMVMETTAAIIILVPVLLPVISTVGVDPLHFGIVMCVNLIIGMLTPPVGVTLFTVAQVTKVPSNVLVKQIWPWIGVSVLVLIIITYVPAIVTFLPNLLLK